jgi:ribonucleotide monophosphatase NagD (HAD superfamily)
MKKLYIDIDGVLLTSRHTQAVPGAVELISH